MARVLQAGMFAIRARRKVASERDFLDAVEKVVRQGTKFSSTYVSFGCLPLISIDRGNVTDPCTKCTIRFCTYVFIFRCNHWLIYSCDL
jgi:hypothetical protein